MASVKVPLKSNAFILYKNQQPETNINIKNVVLFKKNKEASNRR